MMVPTLVGVGRLTDGCACPVSVAVAVATTDIMSVAYPALTPGGAVRSVQGRVKGIDAARRGCSGRSLEGGRDRFAPSSGRLYGSNIRHRSPVVPLADAEEKMRATATGRVYSDDANPREQVRLATGRRPAADLPPVEFVECATLPAVL